MITDPERWAPGYAEAGAYNVTFHAEACDEPGAAGQDAAGRRRQGRPGDRPGHPGRAVPGAAALRGHPADHDDQGRLRRPEVHAGDAGQGAGRAPPDHGARTWRCGSRSTAASRRTPSSRPPRRAPTRSSPAPRSTAPTTRPRRSASCARWPTRAAVVSTGVVRRNADDIAREPDERPDVILVVDDDDDIASFVAFNLKVHGFEVIRARDGQEALEVMEQQPPRPGRGRLDDAEMDGVELTRRLRAEPLTSALPVIMLTAKSMTVDKVVGLTAGVDDYLVKPFDTAELIARVVLDAAAQQGVPRGLAADRAARQRPGPARDRRPDEGRQRLLGRLHRHRPVQERQRRVRLRPRRRVHHRAGPQPAPRGGRRRACRRSSSATSAATTSSSSARPTRCCR